MRWCRCQLLANVVCWAFWLWYMIGRESGAAARQRFGGEAAPVGLATGRRCEAFDAISLAQRREGGGPSGKQAAMMNRMSQQVNNAASVARLRCGQSASNQ